jgi:hypothetical protein
MNWLAALATILGIAERVAKIAQAVRRKPRSNAELAAELEQAERRRVAELAK